MGPWADFRTCIFCTQRHLSWVWYPSMFCLKACVCVCVLSFFAFVFCCCFFFPRRRVRTDRPLIWWQNWDHVIIELFLFKTKGTTFLKKLQMLIIYTKRSAHKSSGDMAGISLVFERVPNVATEASFCCRQRQKERFQSMKSTQSSFLQVCWV